MRYPESEGSRRLTALLALVVLAAIPIVLPAAGQAVTPEPPLANSSNVHLVAHVPGSAAGMNFKDHYAYVSGWGGITVLDIAQADAPRVVGALPLPHFENEDVDLCGNTLLVANDRAELDLGSVLYVLSIANPVAPKIAAVLPLGLTGSGRGSGHIANFSKADCSQAASSSPRPRRARSTSPTTRSSTAPARSGRSAAAARPATGSRATRSPRRCSGRRARPGQIPRRTTTSSSTTRSGAGRRC
jgi:hypothetical protein